MRLSRTLKVGLCALALGVGPASLLAACEKKAETVAAAPVDWTALVNEWIESDLKANPDFAVYQGRHEFDGVLPDWSEAGIEAERKRLKGWKARVEAIDAKQLATDAQRFERDYLLANIDGALFWNETADWPHKNPQFYNLDPGVYLDRPYADAPVRMKAYTKWAAALPRAVNEIKANLKGPLPRPYIDIGKYTFAPLADFMKADVVAVFKDVGDEAAKAEFAKATAAGAAALMDLDAHLESLRATQTEDFALGADLFARMIYSTERVDTSLDDLEAIGRADLKRNQDALAEACAKFAPGKSIQDCVRKEEASKPEGGDFVGYAGKQLVELKQFLIDRQVVSIPGEEEAKVKQSPPYNAQNGAYIDIPGPYEKNMPSYYNIAAPDPTWTRQKQLDYIPGKANLLFTSVHEVWPGHFLQFLHSNRAESIFGKLYVGYAFAEGWAHYSEEMMWEMGLGGDPETHIGQLTNATLRNVRYLSAIGMHAKGMTLAQSKEMFIKEGFQDEGTAEQQSARGAYDPAYLNYTMGKLMIRKLRSDWCVKAGKTADDKACWKDFHNAFLAYGGPPIPLVRGAMMGEPAKSAF